jgi:tetratricopeptide (TPR) repeat protein
MGAAREPHASTIRWARALCAVAVCAWSAPASAVPPGSADATAAYAACDAAEGLSAAARHDALARGMALADHALAADQRDALAHFATACNLGKQMEDAGPGGQLVRLPRLRRELDRALELAPDDADVLTAKGVLLFRLPRLLGGDADEAETLLRHALAVEPTNGTTRCYLARALSARGADAEARALVPHC